MLGHGTSDGPIQIVLPDIAGIVEGVGHKNVERRTSPDSRSNDSNNYPITSGEVSFKKILILGVLCFCRMPSYNQKGT